MSMDTNVVALKDGVVLTVMNQSIVVRVHHAYTESANWCITTTNVVAVMAGVERTVT